MPHIETPTIRRATAEIATRFTLKGTITVVLWAMFVFALAAGLAYTNSFVFAGLLSGALWLYASYSLLRRLWWIKYVCDWLMRGVDRDTAKRIRRREWEYENSDKFTLGEIMVLFAIPVLMIFASSCYFLDDTDTTTIVNGNRVTGPNAQMVCAIPFFQTVKKVEKDQSVHFDAIATTADGHKVRGTITAQLRLSSEREQILRAARQPHPDATIQSRMQQAFEVQFRQEVAKQTLADLKSSLVLELNTSTAANRNLLRTVGVEWSGIIAVSDIHPYLGK